MPSSMLVIKLTLMPSSVQLQMPSSMMAITLTSMPSQSIASNAVFNAGHQAYSIPSPLLFQMPSSMLAIMLTPNMPS
jgi:hypothetical protein